MIPDPPRPSAATPGGGGRITLRTSAWTAGALYLLATIAAFWPLLPHLSSALIGPPEDNMQDFWNAWYFADRVHALKDLYFTKLLAFPEGTSLSYHSFSYPRMAIMFVAGALFQPAQQDVVLLQNILLLASVPLAALGAFLLVRSFTGDFAGALIGGAIFAFNPSHIAHIAHNTHVSAIEFLPFFALFFLRAMRGGTARTVAASIVLFALNALSCWYYLFYCVYFMIFCYAFQCVRERRLWLARPAWIIGLHAAGGFVLLSPIMLPMLAIASSGASGLYAGGSNEYVVDLLGFAAFPPAHLLSSLTAGLYWRMTGNDWERVGYLGLVNVALLASLALRWRDIDRRLAAFVLAGMAVFAILACGNTLHVIGHSTIPLPGMVLDQLPLARNVRTPSRAIVMVYLFLAIGVGYAVSFWLREIRARGRFRAALVLVPAVLLLDFLPTKLATTPVSCPAVYGPVRDDTDTGFGVLDLPRVGGNRSWYLIGNFHMMWQTCHQRPLVLGTVSRKIGTTLAEELIVGDMARQRRQLTDSRVKYIVIHHPRGRLFEWQETDGDLRRYLETYTVVHADDHATLLRVY